MRISDWSSDVCSSDLVLEVLHEDGGDIEAGEIVDLGEGAGVAERVVDRDRPGRQLLQQLLHPARRQRVADRLEEGVAALGVAARKGTRLNSSHYCATPMPSSD